MNKTFLTSLAVASTALLVAVITPLAVDGAAPSATPAGSPAVAVSLSGLKDAFAGKFLVGTAADPGNYSDAEQANMKANYNIITPENCMKPQPIHPSEDVYNWTTADALVKWSEDNHIKIHGHTLAWHSQTPNWFFQDANGQTATREVVMERLHKHIQTVVGHYKGRIHSWDVVNEAINDGGTGEAENLRGSSWFRIIGPDFLTMAFKWAREADPDVKLYYNDYNIDQGAVENKAKHASSMLLLKRLIKDGAPITGVGIQGHWHLDTNIPDVEKSIEDYASLGLQVSISELDVTATGTNSGAMPGGGRGNTPVTPESFQKQAEVYAKLFDVFNRHAKSIDRVTLWGINDRRSWRSGQLPLLFDAQMEPKPAYQAILDVAAGKSLLLK